MATTRPEPHPDRRAPEDRIETRRLPALPAQWSGALRHVVLPLACYLVLAALAFSPHDPFNATTLPQGPVGDPLQMTWFLAYTPWALLHGHNPFVTTALDYPSGVNLGSNTSVPLLGVLAAPVTLTLGPVAALNVLLRLALALSAGALYLVLRRWCRSSVAAFAGGLTYGFGPYLATHLQAEGHLNLIFVPIPALLLAVFDEAFVRQRRRAEVVGLLAGLLGTAQLLISPEVLSDAALLGLVALVGLAARFPSEARRRAAYGARVLAAAALAFVVTAAFPLYEMLAGPGHVRGAVQSVSHLQSFRSDLLEFFLPNANVLLAPSAAVRAAATATAPMHAGGGGAEIGGYLGIPLVVLVVVLLVRFRRDRLVVTVASLGVVAALLSLGGRLQVDGHLTAIRLPEIVLAHLPLLDNTVPARFGLLVLLFAAMLLALGLDRALAAAMLRQHLFGNAALGLLAVLALVAVLPRLPLVREKPATSAAATALLNRAVPRNAVVLAYPFPEPPYTLAMAWQADTNLRFRLLGGYATINGPHHRAQLFAPLLDPPLLQEVLAFAEPRWARHYPAPAATGDVRAALCSFLAAHDVGAVVFSANGPRATSVEQLFSGSLGAPSARGAGLEVWRIGAGRGGRHCHAS